MTTSSPALVRLGIAAGTSPTRRSPGKLSRGTPTIMASSALNSTAARHHTPAINQFPGANSESSALYTALHTHFASQTWGARLVELFEIGRSHLGNPGVVVGSVTRPFLQRVNLPLHGRHLIV